MAGNRIDILKNDHVMPQHESEVRGFDYSNYVHVLS